MSDHTWFRWRLMHFHMRCYMQAVHHERMLYTLMPFMKFSLS